MDIKAIAFDKDGTLLDYEALWLPVARGALEGLLADSGRDIPLEDLMNAIEAYAGIRGVLCHGTYGDIAGRLQPLLGEVTAAQVETAFVAAMPQGQVRPTCDDLPGVLTALRQRGLKLALITSDSDVGAALGMKALGIYDLLDRVYADDGVHPSKPDPYHMHRFCRDFGLQPAEVLMVGDTASDMAFARRSGAVAVAVAKTEADRAVVAPVADVVLPDVSHLPAYLDEGC